jgi:hypothetical protein
VHWNRPALKEIFGVSLVWKLCPVVHPEIEAVIQAEFKLKKMPDSCWEKGYAMEMGSQTEIKLSGSCIGLTLISE